MPNPPISITLVRWPSRDAARILSDYVNGGLEAGARPPRGIDPEFVSYWIRENVKPDCSPNAMLRVSDLLRFYERKDVLDHISRFLARNESRDRAFRRAAYILQSIGEVGSPEQAAFAVRYLNEFLLPQPIAMDFFGIVLQTAESLAASVDYALVGRRLQAAIDSAGKPADLESAAAIPYLQYSNDRVIEYPATAIIMEGKRRLIQSPPAQRLQELLFIYLGQSPLSTPSMVVWAGRMIRKHAMDDAQTEIIAAFTQVLDGAMKSQMPKPKKDFLIHRAAQAIIYLQGKLTFPQQTAYEAIQSGPENFLWDDL
jgi:hypothetical protein